MEKDYELKEAIRQYNVRQYERAFSVFKKYTKQSDAVATYYLAMMYYNGYHVKQNDKEAYQLFTKAREERNPDAAYMLGTMHQFGRYVEKSYQKAFELLSAAFHEGQIEAGIKIAWFYEMGLLEPKNPQKALETYVECAKRDHPYALYKIGMAYLTGQGVKKSIESAHLWLNKALLLGSIDAMNQFRLMGSKSQTDVRSTSELFSIGKELYQQERYQDALAYFEITSKEGSIESYHQLSIMYDEGKGVEASKQKGFEFLLKAAAKNDAEALFKLGFRYENGEGCSSSYLRAESCYVRAKELGHALAEQELLGLRGDIDAR